MNILITGGAGFIGSHIADKFYQNNHNIIILDNLSSGNIDNIKNIKNLKFYNKDIRDKDIEEVFKENKIDMVYHQAAQISVGESIKDPINDADINLIGLINILNMCVKYKVKKIVFASSAAVYGKPEKNVSIEEDKTLTLSFYGLTKKTGEEYIKMYSSLYNLDYVILRYSNVFGPRQNSKGEAGVVAIFTDAMKNNEKVYIDGDGEQTRDFIYVKDVAQANYLVAKENINNEIINVSNNGKTSINELFAYMKKAYNYTKDAIYKEARIGDIKDSRLDNTKLKTLTSYKAVYTVEQGIQEYARS